MSISSVYDPGARFGNRNWPPSLVSMILGPPINAEEVIRTWPPGITAPCSSLAVPIRVPVKVCAAATCDKKTDAADKITMNHAYLLGFISHAPWQFELGGKTRPLYALSKVSHCYCRGDSVDHLHRCFREWAAALVFICRR